MLAPRKLRHRTTVKTIGLRSHRRLAPFLVACLLAVSVVAVAQRKSAPPKSAVKTGHDHGAMPAVGTPAEAEAKPRDLIPDVEVLDQNGQPRRFYSDLVKGRVVIISFIYTTCDGFCPMSGANFSRLQTLLGDRLGRDVFLISVTTDPDNDTSAKLKTWGARFNAKAGWTLVTGKKKEMNDLLRALTGDGPRTGYHVPSVAIFNDLKGSRRRVYGLEAPDQMLKLADELAQW